jgi:alpha-D-xyloside xylohydrolase
VRRALLLTTIFLAAILLACSDARIEIARAPFAVGHGRHRIEVKDGGRTLSFVRDGRELVGLDASAFSVGITAERDATRSWDPWEIERRGEVDSGIEYRTPRAFAAAFDARSVDLDFGDGITARVEIVPATSARFTFTFTTASPKNGPFVVLTRVRVRTSGDPKEGFYGLGEQEDAVDNRGKLRAMQIEADGEIESANNEAHVPVPLVIGTRGWAMFVASTRVGTFDVARKDASVVEATFAEEALRFELFAADAPIDLVGEYESFAGRPRLPPPWALGPLLWRDESRDQAEVEADIAKMRELDLATSGIWIDRPYATAVNTFDFDAARFPDPSAMIARAHAAGLRVALWHTPYLEEATGALATTAREKGFFPPESGVPLNKWSAPIDFTNSDARAFWLENVRRYTAMGIEGFKLDYAEDVVPSLGAKRNVWRFADGSDERTMHHRYSALYHDVYAEAVPDRAAFLLCRAAHWGEQTNGCIIWPGDMDASLTRHREAINGVVGVGGLPATIAMGLSLSSSGFPFFGSDTGGYRHSPPDDETFVRWFEQTALSTVMQVGDSSSQPPWTRGDTIIDLYRRYARLHLRLFPYEWTFAQRMQVDGRPIQRPIGLAHPELGVHPAGEYLFGEDLLVAPVVERGATRRRLVAPKGRWFDFWRGTAHDGPDIEVDAPLDTLPLFLREGAIVPLLRPTIDTLAPATDVTVDSFANDAGVLHALFAPGPAHRFEVYDGTLIERDGSDIRLAPGRVFTRGFALELIATRRPTTVRIDDTPVAFTWREEREGTLTFVAPPRGGRVTIR